MNPQQQQQAAPEQRHFFTPQAAPTVPQPILQSVPLFYNPNAPQQQQLQQQQLQQQQQQQLQQHQPTLFPPPSIGQQSSIPQQQQGNAPLPQNFGFFPNTSVHGGFPTPAEPSAPVMPATVGGHQQDQNALLPPPPPSDEDFEGGALKQQKPQGYTGASTFNPAQSYGDYQQQQPPPFPQQHQQQPPFPPQQQIPFPQQQQQPPFPQQQQQQIPFPQQQQQQFKQQGDFHDAEAKLSLQPSQQQQAFMSQAMATSASHDNLPRPTVLSFGYVMPLPDVSPLFERKNQLSRVDMSEAQASTRFIRPTVQCVPNAPNLLTKWGLPFGVVLHPFAEGEEVPVVNQGSNGIVRCFQCRTYINPFCHFLDGGRKWQCNICKKVNDVPSDYYSQLDEYGQRKDIAKRPELRCGSIDFLAPTEYMARVPQPPAYLFVIDVSFPAVASGMTRLAAKTIKKTLSKLPGDIRTRVGIITFDSSIHFYNLKPSLLQPQMLVVGELQESLLPIPSDLLVNLDESRSVVEALLDKLSGTMFSNNSNVESCLGSVLNSAGRILGRVGGKLLLFLSSLPTLGPNSLKNREVPSIYGSDNEKTLLQPVTPNYKEIALLYSRDQICVDLFIATDQYVDIATLGALPKYTGGQISYYPGFKADVDGAKLKYDLIRTLTRETGFEAVMRIRVSAGLKASNFYGNFFIRSHDLLALPNIDADKTFGVELAHTGNFLTTSNASIQSAVLYTSSSGERRIRVNTITLPITSSLADMYKFADIDATMNLLAKVAADEAPRVGPSMVRNKLRDVLVTSLRTYRNEVSKGGSGAHQLILPDALRLLPLYVCALAKNEALMGGSEVRADERVAALSRLAGYSAPMSALNIHPNLFSLQEYADLMNADQRQQEVLPNKLVPLSKNYLQDNGIYMLDDGFSLYLWVGKQVAADNDALTEIVKAVTVVNSFKLLKKSEEHPVSPLGRSIFQLTLQLRKRSGFKMLHLVTGDNLKVFYSRKLIEDKTIPTTMGYDEFLRHVHQQISGM